jgi:poly [ADP-ribose] polymerase
MPSIKKEDKYILADIGQNNNKFWTIRMFDDHSVETHWGRVGDCGQRKKFPHGDEYSADRFYRSKCNEKERKGYQVLRVVENTSVAAAKRTVTSELKQVAAQQIKTNSKETLDLVTYLAEVNVHSILGSTTMTYDSSRGTFSTPLGVVTKDAIDESRGLLVDIADYVANQDWDNQALIPLLNKYLMLVPQNIGRSKPNPRYLYPTLDAIQRQNSILDSLEASLQMVMSAPALDDEGEPKVQEQLFQVSLTLMEDGKEIDRIRRKYRETLQSMHASSYLDVHRVFSVEIAPMRAAFEQHGIKLGNVWELWHGTKVGNLLSILKSGFLIPPYNASHCTGRMFGNGCYFSDQSTKSLNYAYGYWSGGQDENCFMFLSNVAMGKHYTPTSYTEKLPKPGFDSTFAMAGKSGVANNEMIVYNCNQIDPVYLIQFSRSSR